MRRGPKVLEAVSAVLSTVLLQALLRKAGWFRTAKKPSPGFAKDLTADSTESFGPVPVETTTWSICASPKTEALLFLLIGSVAIWGLGLSVGHSPLVSTREWRIWLTSASAGVALSAVLFYRGVAAFRHLPRAFVGLRMRSKMIHIVLAIGFIILVFGFFYSELWVAHDWPIRHMRVRVAAVSLSVGFTGIPWVALMLLTQRILRGWRDQSSPRDRERVAPIGVYLQLWNMITACLMTFGVFVAVALIPTGALRSLWLAYASQQGEAAVEGEADVTAAMAAKFPALDVLLYGAFFATEPSLRSSSPPFRPRSWRYGEA